MMALGNGPARTMAAEFDSECPGCFEQIDAGDTITLIAGSWVCPDCAVPDDHAVTRRQPAPQTDLDKMGY
jgi:hypothetical protein